jgi:hypothetical protein
MRSKRLLGFIFIAVLICGAVSRPAMSTQPAEDRIRLSILYVGYPPEL